MIEPTANDKDLAQVRSLRQAGLLNLDIAERLGLPLGRVQRMVEQLPRNLQFRGADAGQQPVFKAHHGRF